MAQTVANNLVMDSFLTLNTSNIYLFLKIEEKIFFLLKSKASSTLKRINKFRIFFLCQFSICISICFLL